MRMRAKTRKLGNYLVPAALAALVVAGGFFGRQQRLELRRTAEARIKAWPEASRRMAELMMERYGAPSEIDARTATWREQGPWKRISVRGDSPENCLEQTVGYQVPVEAVEPLRRLNSGVRADPAKNELS